MLPLSRAYIRFVNSTFQKREKLAITRGKTNQILRLTEHHAPQVRPTLSSEPPFVPHLLLTTYSSSPHEQDGSLELCAAPRAAGRPSSLPRRR
jgi:hypothetical protein